MTSLSYVILFSTNIRYSYTGGKFKHVGLILLSIDAHPIKFHNLLDDWTSIPSRGREGIFYLHTCFKTGSGAHTDYCSVGTGVFTSGIKRPWREADHSSPYSAEVMNAWNCTFTLPHVFMASCLIEHRDNYFLPLP
jgi:hypothetical protein